jgi:hypothetical protein
LLMSTVTCFPFLASSIQPSRWNVWFALLGLWLHARTDGFSRSWKLSLVVARMGLQNYVWYITTVTRQGALAGRRS